MYNLKKYPIVFIVIGLICGIVLTLGISKIMVKTPSKEKVKTTPETVEKSLTKEEEISDSIQPSKEEVIESPKGENKVPTVIEIKKSEEDVIAYFEDQERMITTNPNNDSIIDKIKNGFTTMGNFLFNGGEIKGYTFKELTTTAKLKVIKLALTIDNKIDNYFPNYKENIKGTFNNLKAKAAALYIDTTEKICSGSNAVVCNQAKEDFKTMKESFKISFIMIRDILKSGISSIKDYFN